MQNPNGLFSRIFFTSEERRLRAAWRLTGQLVILFGLLMLTGAVWSGARLLLGKEPSFGFIEAQAISAVAFTASIWIARRLLDRRSFTSLGLQIERQTWRDLLAGFLIATILLLVIYGIERLLGWMTIIEIRLNRAAPLDILSALGLMLLVFSVTGWGEEIYFRGYLLTNLSEGINLSWGILISSLIFGFVHLANPHPSVFGVVGICLFGLLMAFAYQRSGRLWLPIGLHTGWNFVEGPIFGFPVSGINTISIFKTQINGPVLFTGGAFGPEAGLVVLPSLAIGAFLVWIYTRPMR